MGLSFFVAATELHPLSLGPVAEDGRSPHAITGVGVSDANRNNHFLSSENYVK